MLDSTLPCLPVQVGMSDGVSAVIRPSSRQSLRVLSCMGQPQDGALEYYGGSSPPQSGRVALDGTASVRQVIEHPPHALPIFAERRLPLAGEVEHGVRFLADELFFDRDVTCLLQLAEVRG